MCSPALRYLILLSISAWIPAGVMAAPASGSVHPGTWQIVGPARALPTLYRPTGLAVDPRGDVYVADSGNFRIVELGPGGQLLAHFGDAYLRPGTGTAPSPGGQYELGAQSVTVNAAGTVFVADPIHHAIRVFSPQHRLVGSWLISVPGATVVQLAVAIGPHNSVVVAIDARVNCTVRLGPSYCATYYVIQRRSQAGTLLGQFHSPIGPSGQEVSPQVISHIAVAVANRGEIYVVTGGMEACYKDCLSFHFLIEHAPGGKVLGHWGKRELDVSANWPAIAIGGRGNIFLVDDYNHRIEKRTAGGAVVARRPTGSIFPTSPLCSGTPYADGCREPVGVAVDRNGNLYVSDPGSDRILKLSSRGRLLAQWGAGGAQTGRLWFPGSLALDAGRRLWVDDSVNSRVQMLGTDGRFHVQFAVPHAGSAMALDRQGNLYIGQLLGQSVVISTFSPAGKLLARWGGLHLAELPSGIAIAPNGDVFVVGFLIFRDASQLNMNGVDILRLDPKGRQLGLIHVSSADPRSGIAVDAQENSYIAYGATPHVEKYSVGGALLATWGAPKPSFDASAPSPAGITLDGAGNLYVASTPQNVIDEFGPTGTLLGSWGSPGSYAGQFHEPSGIAVDPAGTIYVADTGNHRIQRRDPAIRH